MANKKFKSITVKFPLDCSDTTKSVIGINGIAGEYVIPYRAIDNLLTPLGNFYILSKFKASEN